MSKADAEKLRHKTADKARALPQHTKDHFWKLMRSGYTLGRARVQVGIDDIMVAGELVEQMYRNDLKELGHENNNNR